ncbi:MAG: hypothetical protein B6230_06745 [Desulfobacteraceae bacterium 4572_89]|nr:MAG: hypothetical protein B6230_06745 [Desulfobacteraceae bacterium 4572_89]
MIIVCEKCSTRFNLDESFLKPGGSKVRCSQCQNIFTAFPPVSDVIPAFESDDEIEFTPSVETGPDKFETDKFETDDFDIEPLEPDFQDSEFDDGEHEFDEADFEIETNELEIEDSGLEMEETETNAADIEISFDQDSESLEIETDELTFDDDIEFDEPDLEIETNATEEDFGSLEFESLDQDQDSLSLDTDDDPEPELSFEDEDFDLKEEPDLPEPLTPIEDDESDTLPDENFSSYDQVLNQDTEPEEDIQKNRIDGEQEIEIEETQTESVVEEETSEKRMEDVLIEKSDPSLPTPGPSRKRKKKSTLGAPVMVLLLIFLIVAAAYITGLTTGYKIPYLSSVRIPFLEQYLKKEIPAIPELKPIPNEGSVNGRFISNDTAGELFVITGRIENPSTKAYSHIQVKGTLITKGKVKAKTMIAFCGNIISEELLKTGNILDINKQLTIREGSNNSNVNVKPGAFVPFMLVFSSLPDNLENFTVEVVADQKNETVK